MQMSSIRGAIAALVMLLWSGAALAVVGEMRITDGGRPVGEATVSLFTATGGGPPSLVKTADEEDDDGAFVFFLSEDEAKGDLIVEVVTKDGKAFHQPVDLERDGTPVTRNGEPGRRIAIDLATATPGRAMQTSRTAAASGSPRQSGPLADLSPGLFVPGYLVPRIELELHAGLNTTSTSASFAQQGGASGAGDLGRTGGLFGADVYVTLAEMPIAALPGALRLTGMVGGNVTTGGRENGSAFSFHPGPGFDTFAFMQTYALLQAGLGVGVPLMSTPNGPIELILLGGLLAQRTKFGFVTDESGGGGQRNEVSKTKWKTGPFGRVLGVVPLGGGPSGMSLRWKIGADFYSVGGERLDLTTQPFGFRYSAAFGRTTGFNLFTGFMVGF